MASVESIFSKKRNPTDGPSVVAHGKGCLGKASNRIYKTCLNVRQLFNKPLLSQLSSLATFKLGFHLSDLQQIQSCDL